MDAWKIYHLSLQVGRRIFKADDMKYLESLLKEKVDWYSIYGNYDRNGTMVSLGKFIVTIQANKTDWTSIQAKL